MSGMVMQRKGRMRATQDRGTRSKISTTIAPETMEFLERKVKSGEASSIAEALDAAIAALRRLENRRRLAKATAEYFAGVGAEENALGAEMASGASGIDFNEEL